MMINIIFLHAMVLSESCRSAFISNWNFITYGYYFDKASP